MKKQFVLIVTMGLLAACGSKESYTVDYLMENPDILDTVLNDCKQNNQSSENCQNANTAQQKVFNKTGGKERHKWQ